MHAQTKAISDHASTQKLLQLDSRRCVRKGVAWHSQQDSAESPAAGRKTFQKTGALAYPLVARTSSSHKPLLEISHSKRFSKSLKVPSWSRAR